MNVIISFTVLFSLPQRGDGGGLIFLETVNCQLKKLKKKSVSKKLNK